MGLNPCPPFQESSAVPPGHTSGVSLHILFEQWWWCLSALWYREHGRKACVTCALTMCENNVVEEAQHANAVSTLRAHTWSAFEYQARTLRRRAPACPPALFAGRVCESKQTFKASCTLSRKWLGEKRFTSSSQGADVWVWAALGACWWLHSARDRSVAWLAGALGRCYVDALQVPLLPFSRRYTCLANQGFPQFEVQSVSTQLFLFSEHTLMDHCSYLLRYHLLYSKRKKDPFQNDERKYFTRFSEKVRPLFLSSYCYIRKTVSGLL